MIRPPFAERLLVGLLTDPALRDAILGDLAEEWHSASPVTGAGLPVRGTGGRPSGRCRTCCATGGSPPRRDVQIRLAGVSIVSVIAVLPIAAAHVMASMSLAVARAVLGSLSAASDSGMPLTLNWLEIAGIPLAMSAVCAPAGAYVLGSRSRVAPLVSVFWLGTMWIAVSAALPFALQWPSWYFMALPAVLAGATAYGGILATLRPLHAARSPAPSSRD